MLIRQLEQDDLAACAGLFGRVFSRPPWNEPWSADSAGNRLRFFVGSPGSLGVVAVDRDGILGFVLGNIEPFHSGDLFYLREMCVATELQNSGIGNALLEKLESVLALQSVAAMYLVTEREIPAARFYLKNGFDCSEATGFYRKQLGLGM